MSASGAYSKDETEATSKTVNHSSSHNNIGSNTSESSSKEDLIDNKRVDEKVDNKDLEIYVSDHNEASDKIDFIGGDIDDNGREPTE